MLAPSLPLHLDTADARIAVYRDDARSGQHACAEHELCDRTRWSRRDYARPFLDERQGPDMRVPHGQQVREGDELGADDDRPIEGTQPREVDHLLEGYRW